MAPRTRIRITKGRGIGLNWWIDGVQYESGEAVPNWGLTAAATTVAFSVNGSAIAFGPGFSMNTGISALISCDWGVASPRTMSWMGPGSYKVDPQPGAPAALPREYFDSLAKINNVSASAVQDGPSTIEIVHDDDSMQLPADWPHPAD